MYFLWIILSCVFLASATSWPNEISIGLINSQYHPILYQLVSNETVKDLKTVGILPSNINLKFYQSFACDDQSSLDVAFKNWNNFNVSIIFGPECSLGAATVALIASSLNKPIIGYLSITSDLANKTKYTTLARVSYTMSYLAQAIATTLLYHNWTTLAIIRWSGFINSNIVLSGIPEAFQASGITISNDITVEFDSSASMENALMIIKLTARIILVCGGNTPADALPFLRAAFDANMMTPDYVYITPLYVKQTLTPWEPWMALNANNSYRSQTLALYKNAVVIQTYGETTAAFKQFVNDTTNKVNSDPAKFAVAAYTNASLLRLGLFRDALYLYALILNHSVNSGYGAEITGKQILQASSYYDFTGVTGRVVMDNYGERVSNYYVMKLDNDSNFTAYLLLGAENKTNMRIMAVLEQYQKPIWNSPNNSPPLAIPFCGFLNDQCPKYIISVEALSISLPACILTAVLVTSLIMHIKRRKAFERELLQASWKIDLKDLHYISKPATSSSLTSFTISTSSSFGSIRCDGRYEGCGYYNDSMVAIKRWRRSGNIKLHRENLLHLKTLKEMNHDNVNGFVGLYIDGGPLLLCVWVYCSKRSLQEIIYNEDLRLDDNFKISILRDVVSGLDYIHMSAIGYHGRLFASNCLVDSRWIVKLTDFGLQPVLYEMNKQKAIELKVEEDMDKLLCTAPEMLRLPLETSNLKPADIYQYGMIMYQVLFREEPFADSELPAADILIHLKGGTSNDIPLRPHIKTLKELDLRIHNLFLLCWQENPFNRPTVQATKKEIFAGTRTFGKNLMDHVMNMLEKYTTNLERVVEERTQQLNGERQRADRLLYQLLPKSVADSLKSGQPVNPETFDCVTIYFSDIVGFTTVCARSSPVEVVTMLNGLYSRFDEIILSFNAYKVETIGDAYLVASGLPVRDGDSHVVNIAGMSLQILQAIKKFHIPHLPQEELEIRTGIHSGPVAAGVVGVTMPKYCLFGDTVNFASRMESTGEAGRIHLTKNAKLMLDKHQEFITIERGQINVKGKGLCTTYWLLHKVQ